MTGKDISIACETGEIPAYLAEPKPAEKSGVGVVVVSAIFGVDGDTKKICDDLAAAGHPALALNMFWADEVDSGVLDPTPKNAELGRERVLRLDREIGNSYIEAALKGLRALNSCNGKVTVFGFCFGGPYVVEAAGRFEVAGGIVFHGSYVEKFLPELPLNSCPLEFHYGDNDAVAPMAAIAQVKAACEQRDNAKLYVYPGGEHGYMFPNRGAGYHGEAARLSWERALAFLGKI